MARALGGVVLSVDSMQVYRGMDIGTAKPTTEERAGIVHHMLDLVEPEESYSVARFQAQARAVIAAAATPVVICGGSGLHFRAVVDAMSFPPTDPGLRQVLEDASLEELNAELLAADPGAASHVALDNKRRVIRAVEALRLTGLTPSLRAGSAEAAALHAYKPLLEFTAIGCDPGDALEARIDERLKVMQGRGLLEEVAALRRRLGPTAAEAVGYRQLIPVVDGEVDLTSGLDAARQATRRLARRQRTWFRRDPRVRWIPWHDDSTVRARRVLDALT